MTDSPPTGIPAHATNTDMASVLDRLKHALLAPPELSSVSQHVRSLLQDPSSMQSRHCTRYINQVFRFMESDAEQRHSFISPQKFIHALVELTIASEGLSPKESVAVEQTIEDYLFPQIYTKLTTLCGSDDDVLMTKQYERFSSISQQELKVSTEMLDPSLSPWSHAIAKISTLPFSPTPTRKLHVILSAAQSVYSNPNIAEDTTIGADVFVPIFIYILLKAKIPNIWTEIKFIHEYSSERHVHGELGYYFVTLEFCAKYILDLTPDKLSDPEERLASTETWLVCEQKRFKKWSNTAQFVTVVDTIRLKGYKAVTVIDWLFNPRFPFTTVLEVTNSEKDVVEMLILRPVVSLLNFGQQKLLKSLFMEPQALSSCLSCVSGRFGSITLIDRRNARDLQLLTLNQGKIDDQIDLIEDYLSLALLGSISVVSEPLVPIITEEIENSFRSEFGVPVYLNLTDAIRGIFLEFQLFLRGFDCLSSIAPLSAKPDTPTVHGLLRFFSVFNTSLAELFEFEPKEVMVSPKFLKFSGCDESMLISFASVIDENSNTLLFSFQTLQLLRSLMVVIRSHFDTIGHSITSPVLSFNEFQSSVKDFQDNYGQGHISIRNGILNLKTLELVIRLSKEHSSKPVNVTSKVANQASLIHIRKVSSHRFQQLGTECSKRLSTGFDSPFIPLDLYPVPPPPRED
ncbi:hypothetical protein P9112_006970 [Eukaryota sp. TZLM1-RC]